jgi:hypothetical protein
VPREHRQTEVDRGGIQCIDSIFQIKPERLIGVEAACCGDQALREIAVDARITRRIGIGERVACNAAANPQVVELGALRT